EKPLKLPPQKADLVEFMVADLRDSTKQFEECLKQARNDATRQDASAHLAELADALVKTADFFDLADLTRLTKLLVAVAPKLAEAEGSILSEVAIRVRGIEKLINQQADALQRGKQLSWNLGTFIERFEALIAGRSLAADLTGKHQNDVDKLLALDGVTPGTAAGGASPAPPAAAVATAEEHEAEHVHEAEHDATAKTAAGPASEAAKKNLAEATVRVEVSRLEDLLNLVGQMVLTKNRLLALSRRLRDHHVPTEFAENVTQASSDLDRLTSELQVGVMRTRMQPLAKLFDRYPRVIRDIARMTGKKIDLEVQGKETEVDKSVLELLADPLVHILRNSADHGVEQPDVRAAGGKAEMGRVVLTAEHQGSHVRVAVTDDGKGLDREVLGRKAVEKGLTTVDQLSTMSDDQVFRFIFAPGFSTAEKISDLSGRGVGMDVVNTNVAKMNGSVNIFSGKGKGTTIEILIPLTGAIMPAMMVGVGKHLYAIPLQTVAEIVRPEASEIHSVRGAPVMRLRDSVLPLVDMRKRLHETGDEVSQRFAVVVGVGGQKAGLMVDRLVGQQEIVIKPLDDQYTKGGPFSGATIREDGDVSLILDVVQLIRTSQPAGAPAVRAAA
ncbi:MAG: chemotaxis protein CheA, partial [Phycisphaeraceae bacterium]|nr:chemotaxis protein CheA [Phycisphaeraceae bacterium]